MEQGAGGVNIAVYIIEGLLIFFIIYNILSARKGRHLYIRRISGLSALDEAIGRSTEMGRPMLYSAGLSGLDVVGLQAMAILSHVVRKAARFGTRVIVPLCDPLLYTVADEVTREAYAAEGVPEQFRPEDVRFLSDQQFAWATGVVGILHREEVATALYFGYYYAESLILTENGQAVGAIQIAGTPSTTQIPFFLASCDYTIIGEEYYAASAYISREPTLLGSLVGQDWSKMLIVGLVMIGAVLVTMSAVMPYTPWLAWLKPVVNGFNFFLGFFPKG